MNEESHSAAGASDNVPTFDQIMHERFPSAYEKRDIIKTPAGDLLRQKRRTIIVVDGRREEIEEIINQYNHCRCEQRGQRTFLSDFSGKPICDNGKCQVKCMRCHHRGAVADGFRPDPTLGKPLCPNCYWQALAALPFKLLGRLISWFINAASRAD